MRKTLTEGRGCGVAMSSRNRAGVNPALVTSSLSDLKHVDAQFVKIAPN